MQTIYVHKIKFFPIPFATISIVSMAIGSVRKTWTRKPELLEIKKWGKKKSNIKKHIICCIIYQANELELEGYRHWAEDWGWVREIREGLGVQSSINAST